MNGFESLVAAGRVSERVSLGPLTTYKFGGPARWYAEARSAGDLSEILEAKAACRDRLDAAGINLSAYNSAASAADLNDLRQALGYESWNLYGVSYGARLALTATPDAGYQVKSWSGTDDDTLTTVNNTVTMDADRTVTVEFGLGNAHRLAHHLEHVEIAIGVERVAGIVAAERDGHGGRGRLPAAPEPCRRRTRRTGRDP